MRGFSESINPGKWLPLRAIQSLHQAIMTYLFFQALRSFKVAFEVDPAYHPKIIGRKGMVISKIRDRNGVQIQFPERTDDEDARGLIEITGYEQSANDAKDEIMKIVKSLVSL
jgi:predicted PilT family ATPase